MSPRRVEFARGALEEGLAHNAAGRPAPASRRFRVALNRLGPESVQGPVAGQESAYVRARALLGLVMSDFELRADAAASRTTLDAAERWARTAGAPAVEVAVDGQRGLLEMRAGQTAAALTALDRAALRVDDAEAVDACCLFLNRGSLLLELGHLDRARSDLEACAVRAAALGDPLLMFKARHNLGYLEFLAGDLPAALTTMAEAARLDHGGSTGVALLDRAQVLLEAGLVTEADSVLAEAADLLRTQGVAHDLGEVELSRSHCAVLLGQPQVALGWARSARRRFARRGNVPWLARAELAVCRALLAERLRDDPPDARRLVRVAERSRRLGERSGEGGVPAETARSAMVTSAEAFVAAGRLDEARTVLEAVGGPAGRELLSLAVQVRVVKAGLAFATGDRSAGRRHVRSGQAVLAEHRLQLGSVEACTAAAVHGDRLTQADVGAALQAEDAALVLDAVERGRATFAGPARVRPPDDPELADLLAQLRRSVEAARALPLDDDGSVAARDALRKEGARVRDLVRDRAWRLGDGLHAPVPGTARDLRNALDTRGAAAPVVADYLVHRGTVHAVVVDGAGSRLVRLAEAVEVTELTRRVRADLDALATELPAALRDVVGRSLDGGLRRLDTLLVRPVVRDGPLHVVAGGGLVAVPWGLVPSRAGFPTSVSTRLGDHLPAPRPAEAVAIAGPDLRLAQEEVESIARVWPSGTAVVGEQADCAATTVALRTADVVHVAAHGHHEAENPLFSWLRLADGPLFAYELEGMALPGSIVVLSACEVGRVTERPGGGVLGLASVLLRLGAHTVVAALAPLRDDVAAQVMPAFHGLLREGRSPAEALASVCSRVDEPVPLTCFSAGIS